MKFVKTLLFKVSGQIINFPPLFLSHRNILFHCLKKNIATLLISSDLLKKTFPPSRRHQRHLYLDQDQINYYLLERKNRSSWHCSLWKRPQRKSICMTYNHYHCPKSSCPDTLTSPQPHCWAGPAWLVLRVIAWRRGPRQTLTGALLLIVQTLK